MGSPCVLLNSLVLFFVPGQEGVATNEVGECKLSQQKEGKCEPPREGGMQTQSLVETHTLIHTHLFSCLFFFNTVILEGTVATKYVSLAKRGNRKDVDPMPNYSKLRMRCVCYAHTCFYALRKCLWAY